MSTSILINIMTYTIILSTGFSCAYLIFISDTLNNLFPIMSRYVIKNSSFEYLCLKTVKFIDISTDLGPVSLKTVNVTNSATFNTDFPWLLHTYTLPNYFAISALSHSPWVSQSNHKNWQTKYAATNYFFVFSAERYSTVCPSWKRPCRKLSPREYCCCLWKTQNALR